MDNIQNNILRVLIFLIFLRSVCEAKCVPYFKNILMYFDITYFFPRLPPVISERMPFSTKFSINVFAVGND